MDTFDHAAAILDQFTRQAELFARAPELHNEAILTLVAEAARASKQDEALDVACGPGTVVVEMARWVHRSVGLDATPAMLEQARQLAAERRQTNVEWHLGSVEALPFATDSFDIVTCRFAFHHFPTPAAAFAEMLRVCRPGGRIVVCDGVASDDPAKAAAFNAMERHRDPSTVEFRTLATLRGLFLDAGLGDPEETFFQVPSERESTITKSFPANDDREHLRRLITDSVNGDLMGLKARRDGDTVHFAYQGVVLTAVKPAH